MKTITALVAAATLLAGVGAVAAQDARSVGPETFLSVVPFAGSTLYSGRSAHVSPTDTARVYGNGPDGQGMLAPHINGVF